MSFMPTAEPGPTSLTGVAMNPTPMGFGMALGGMALGSMLAGSKPQLASYRNNQWYFGGRPVNPQQMQAYGTAYRQGPAQTGTIFDHQRNVGIMNGMMGNTTNMFSPGYQPGINHAPLDTHTFNNIAGNRINTYATEHNLPNPFAPAAPRPQQLAQALNNQAPSYQAPNFQYRSPYQFI